MANPQTSGSGAAATAMAPIATAAASQTKVSDTTIPQANEQQKEEAIYGAFLLGWLIKELRSRIRIAYQQSKTGEVAHGFGVQLASQWRALFSRIADLHHTTFPNSLTAQTLYDPPILPYLHPTDAPDYAEIGIREESRNGAPMLEKFA